MLPTLHDEVVFKNRNKIYGAYYIRIRYVRNVIFGFIVTFIFAVGTSFYFIKDYLFESNDVVYNEDFLNSADYSPDQMLIEEVEVKPLEEQVISIAKPKSSIVASPKVVAPSKAITPPSIKDDPKPINDSVLNGDMSKSQFDLDSMITIDQLPAYTGGVDAFRKYIERRIPYPDTSYLRQMKGPLVISFIVSKRGYVEYVELNQFGGTPWGLIIERILKSSPKWAPASKNGKPVKMLCRIPIEFVN